MRWEWVNSQKRRDLPTPGSPTTATTWPCAAPARLLQRPAELLQLGVAADELREPARGGGLQPRARGAGPDELVDLDRARPGP